MQTRSATKFKISLVLTNSFTHSFEKQKNIEAIMVVAVKNFKLAYMPVPKAACSSVKSALALVDPDVSIKLSDIQKNNRLIHTLYPTTRLKPNSWKKYSDWFRFTVVRDPLKRLLSVYSDRVMAKNELFNSPKIRRQSQLPPDPDPDFFFQNIKEYIQLSSVVKHHALSSRLFIGPKLRKFDRVFTVDEIATLEDILSERVGKRVVVPRLNSSKSKIGFSDLSQDTQDYLAEYLADEYNYLARYCPSPF